MDVQVYRHVVVRQGHRAGQIEHRPDDAIVNQEPRHAASAAKIDNGRSIHQRPHCTAPAKIGETVIGATPGGKARDEAGRPVDGWRLVVGGPPLVSFSQGNLNGYALKNCGKRRLHQRKPGFGGTRNLELTMSPAEASPTPARSKFAAEQLRLHSDRFAIARLLLIMMVVYVHVPLEIPQQPWGGSATLLEPIYILHQTLLRSAVSGLTVMSGFILFATGADGGAFATISKKIKTMAIPFLFWNGIAVVALACGQKFGLLSGTRIALVTGDLSHWAEGRVWADALFAYSRRPVNYPLYFLRDLFIITLACIAFHKIVRAYCLPCIVMALVVAEYNFDGLVILRTPMLPLFLIGAALAIYPVRLDFFDNDLGLLSAALLILCIVGYYAPRDSTRYLTMVVGCLTVWSLTGRLSRGKRSSLLVRASSYSFPIYLIHGIMLFVLLGVGFHVTNDGIGLVSWIVAPAMIALACVAVYASFRALMPGLAAAVTGGRVGRAAARHHKRAQPLEV